MRPPSNLTQPPDETRRSRLVETTPQTGGFTRIELFVVLSVLALLAMFLAPALARTQPESRAARCLNNHRQLCRAWLMYANDNNDRLATSVYYGTSPPTQPTWAAGRMDWLTSSDNTNTVYLTDPQYSILVVYFGKDARLFKCPADQYLSPFQRSSGLTERVRSISQNIYASNNLGTGDSAYAQVTKLSGLLNPKPAETWISIDEHPDSINDSRFWAPYPLTLWSDIPANYHDGGAGFAFADGRGEVHRWQASVLKFRVGYQYPPVSPWANGDADMSWLRYHTPRPPGVN